MKVYVMRQAGTGIEYDGPRIMIQMTKEEAREILNTRVAASHYCCQHDLGKSQTIINLATALTRALEE